MSFILRDFLEFLFVPGLVWDPVLLVLIWDKVEMYFNFNHARIGKRFPIVLGLDETNEVISNLQGEFHLMASI